MPRNARSTCLTASASRSFSTPVASRTAFSSSTCTRPRSSAAAFRVKVTAARLSTLTFSLPDQVDHARDQAGRLAGAGGRFDQDISVELADDEIARGLVRRECSAAGPLP